MERVVATITAGDAGSSVANLQDALLALSDHQIIRTLDAPNRPTKEELQELINVLRQERMASSFGSATIRLVVYFQIQQGIGDNPDGIVEERTAARLNEH